MMFLFYGKLFLKFSFPLRKVNKIHAWNYRKLKLSHSRFIQFSLELNANACFSAAAAILLIIIIIIISNKEF